MSTEENQQPLVRLEPGGNASIIDYNIPEPVSYSGQYRIELGIDPDWFTDSATDGETFSEWVGREYDVDIGPVDVGAGSASIDEAVRERITSAIGSRLGTDGGPVVLPANNSIVTELGRSLADSDGGGFDGVRANMRARRGTIVRDLTASSPSTTTAASSESTAREAGSTETARSATIEPRMFVDGITYPLNTSKVSTAAVDALRPEAVTTATLNNQLTVLRPNFADVVVPTIVPAPTTLVPRLMLVERYRISTYLGDYGAGRTLKTFSLLPGEHTTISVETFQKSTEEREQASSIFDSFTETAASEFESHVETEQWDKESYAESFGWDVNSSFSSEAKAGINLGIVNVGGSAGFSISGGMEGATEAAHEEFSKTVTSALSKHANESSTRRDVQVNTSYEATTEESETRSVVRDIENINLSRTLNFVFRQMNQEFHTVVHLVDVRVAYTNGAVRTSYAGDSVSGLNYREVPLWQLDDLLADVVDPDHHDEVTEIIEQELSSLINYAGEQQSFVERAAVSDENGDPVREYLRVRRLTDTYEDKVIEGVIMSAVTNVMRTEGVIVEALLGQANALDEYSTGLQTESVRTQSTENDALTLETQRVKLGMSIVRNGETEKGDLYHTVFGSPATNGEAEADTDTDEPSEPAAP